LIIALAEALLNQPVPDLAVTFTQLAAFVPTSISRLQVEYVEVFRVPRLIAPVEINMFNVGNTFAVTIIQLTVPVATQGIASSHITALSKEEVQTTLQVPICVAA
jgi:hypothetical protein